jgi:hypothetical protein
VLGAVSGRLLDKLKGTNVDEYPGLREAVHVIIRVLESPTAQQAKDPLPRWLADTGFAAGYLLKRFDFTFLGLFHFSRAGGPSRGALL